MTESEDQMEMQAKSVPSASVGALLKATRLRMGQDLKQVSLALRIRQLFLQAIEEGRFDELPGPTYALGFVRSYADFLGLDSEEVARRFRAETSGASARKDLVFPTPAAEKRLPSGALVAAALALGALVYGGWYAFSTANRPVAEAVPEVPDRLAKVGESPSSEPAKTEDVKKEAASEEAQPVSPVQEDKPQEAPSKPEAKAEAKTIEVKIPEKPVEATPAPKAEAVEPATPRKPEPPKIEPGKPTAMSQQASLPTQAPTRGMGGLAITAQPRTLPMQESMTPVSKPSTPEAAAKPPEAQAASATPAPSPSEETRAPKVFGQTEGDVRLILKATGDSWIQVRDEKGNLIATRLLKKDDQFRVPTGQGRLMLTTGDAGALAAIVDGVLVTPSLGPSGSVRRDLALDPDRIKAGNQ